MKTADLRHRVYAVCQCLQLPPLSYRKRVIFLMAEQWRIWWKFATRLRNSSTVAQSIIRPLGGQGRETEAHDSGE